MRYGSGIAGNTIPLHAVPLKHDTEWHLGADEKGEKTMRENNERKEERGEKKYILNKNCVV